MGASSSGLLDEAKISNIKGLVDSSFQRFRVFYCQQYSAAYIGHLHQEVEPKKEGRGLLLTRGPQYAPEEVLYQGNVKFSCWDEQGKKCRERYTILRRDYKVEIHENMESFNRGCAAKLVLQPAGGSVFTTEEESRAHLEQTCAGILNGVKEDSSSVVSSPAALAVYLHLPYMGHTCFLFQQEEERDNFLSTLKTCIRHGNLDPWCDSSYESQAYIRALQLYRQDKGCYDSWEMLLGTEEQVLACQVMEEVLPWLQSQLQSRVKGKKTERIRQWLATVQATYTLVLEQLTASLEALREECRQTASANQALIRSNLDQIMSSHLFLEEKIRACIHEEAEKVCSESVAPYLSSILEALTENISAGIQGMRHKLHTQMDSAFTHTNGGTEDTKKALSTLRSISLDQSYGQVESLTEKLQKLKQRFGLNSPQRLVNSAHLEMEQLLDSTVYTLELFLQSSARLQPSQIPVKMERAKERVLKQLDYDSRVVQRRLYEEALLKITLPALSSKMDSKWKNELQQFEQYIFSDYSSFILVRNIYDDVLQSILSKEIETAVQDAASKKSNNLLLDTSDLAISQYSLLGLTPPRSAPDSPATSARDSSAAAAEDPEPAPVVEEGGQKVPKNEPDLNTDAKPDPGVTQSRDQSTVSPSPVIVVTQQFDESAAEEASCIEETREEFQLATSAPSKMESATAEPSSTAPTDSDAAEVGTPTSDSTNPITDSPDLLMSSLSSPQSTDAPAACAQSDPPATPESSATPDLSTLVTVTEDTSDQHPCPSSSPPPCTDTSVKIRLGSLCEAIGCDSVAPSVMQTMERQTTDRAVYLTGQIKDNWEVERVKEEKQLEAAEEVEVHEIVKEEKKIEAAEEVDVRERVKEEKQIEAAEEVEVRERVKEEKQIEAAEEVEVRERVKEEKQIEAAEKVEVHEIVKEEKKIEAAEEVEVCERVKEDKKIEAAEGVEVCERVKEDKKIEAAEEVEVHETVEEVKEETQTGEEKEEEIEKERSEEQMKGINQSVGETVNEGCRSSEPPAESTTALTTEQREGEERIDGEEKGSKPETEKRKEDEEEAEQRGVCVENEGKKEKDKEEKEVFQSTQPVESQPESTTELPLDSVAIIRELVTEITEVETVVSPCPNGSHTDM